MKDGQPIRFENDRGKFTVSETPTGQESIGMIPKGPVYLGGEINRVSCEPLYETEARESRERDQLDTVRRGIEDLTPKVEKDQRHMKNLHGGKGFDGLTGFHKGTYYDRGVPRPPKK